MVAISNIVAAEAVVGLHGKEVSILKKVIIPCLLYLFLVGLIGLVQ
jgi:L-lactate permease